MVEPKLYEFSTFIGATCAKQMRTFVDLAGQVIVHQGKGHGWPDYWKSQEDVTAFADWFDHIASVDLACTWLNPTNRLLR